MKDNPSNIKLVSFGKPKPAKVTHEAVVVKVVPTNTPIFTATQWNPDPSLLPLEFQGYANNRIGKPGTTRAHSVEGSDHSVDYRPSEEGDWIVMDHRGCFFLCSDRLFKQLYRIDKHQH